MNLIKRFGMPKWTDAERAKADMFYGVPVNTPTPEVKTKEVAVETLIPAELVETPQIITKPENVITIPEPDPAPVKKERKPRETHTDMTQPTKLILSMLGVSVNGLTTIRLNVEHSIKKTFGARAIDVKCDVCGWEFVADPYYVKGGQTKCDCQMKHKRTAGRLVEANKKEELVAA